MMFLQLVHQLLMIFIELCEQTEKTFTVAKISQFLQIYFILIDVILVHFVSDVFD